MAGWDWDLIGPYSSKKDAVFWYKRQGIADADADIKPKGEGFELWIRDSAVGKEDRNRGRGFF